MIAEVNRKALLERPFRPSRAYAGADVASRSALRKTLVLSLLYVEPEA